MNTHSIPHLDDALELADLLRPSWPGMDRELRASGVPLNDGDGSGTGNGGGGEGDGSGANAGNEGGSGDGNGGEGAGSGSGSGDGGGDGEPSGSGGGGAGGDDTVTMPRGEAERLKREVAKAAKDKRDRERKEAEDAGEHTKVVQQVEQERDEKDQRISELETELSTLKNGSAVRDVAERLHFHDTEDAVLRVPSEVAERGDAAIESYLRDVIKKSPHLVGDGSTRSSASITDTGGGGGSTLTAEDVKSMSREEISKRWDEVQEALKQGS